MEDRGGFQGSFDAVLIHGSDEESRLSVLAKVINSEGQDFDFVFMYPSNNTTETKRQLTKSYAIFLDDLNPDTKKPQLEFLKFKCTLPKNNLALTTYAESGGFIKSIARNSEIYGSKHILCLITHSTQFYDTSYGAIFAKKFDYSDKNLNVNFRFDDRKVDNSYSENDGYLVSMLKINVRKFFNSPNGVNLADWTYAMLKK
ncbi:hypothetical protein ISS07_05515 [Candidatus Woesearchaeota archaeon]|nr:hypothetical protein [Candidatus Woesearchaeota archaeon]